MLNMGSGDDPTGMYLEQVKEFPSKVGEYDVRVQDKDKDWVREEDVQWLKGVYAIFLPTVKEEEMQELWGELENAMRGREKKVRLTWPVVVLPATRK
jgi:hypothetical protein